MTPNSLIKLHACATIFAIRYPCSAQEIADILDMPVNSVYHLAKQPEWDEALDSLRFQGPRKFATQPTRDPQRDTGELVAQAHAFYTVARKKGCTQKQAVSAVVEDLRLKRRRINEWAERYNWEKNL